jgi:GTP1/Obg family GTP-binding protein
MSSSESEAIPFQKTNVVSMLEAAVNKLRYQNNEHKYDKLKRAEVGRVLLIVESRIGRIKRQQRAAQFIIIHPDVASYSIKNLERGEA